MSLLIDSSIESLRLGSLGDFCAVMKFSTLLFVNPPSVDVLFKSEQVRRFCYSNRPGKLHIDSSLPPSLDPKVQRPNWSLPQWLDWLSEFLGEVVHKEGRKDWNSDLLLSDDHTVSSILREPLQSLHDLDIERFDMLTTTVQLFIMARTDPRERELLESTPGHSFIFSDAIEQLEVISEELDEG